MTKNLKPCPFCGSKKVIVYKDSINPKCCFVFCEGCRVNTADFDTKKEAIEAWNRRAWEE